MEILRVHRSMNFEKWINYYNYNIEIFHCPKKFPWPHSHSQPQETTVLVSIIQFKLSVLEVHVNLIIEYVCFCVLFVYAISCNIIILRFIHIVSYVDSSFLLLLISTPLFTHLSIYEQYRLFTVVTMMNKTAVNICIQIVVWTCLFSWVNIKEWNCWVIW